MLKIISGRVGAELFSEGLGEPATAIDLRQYPASEIVDMLIGIDHGQIQSPMISALIGGTALLLFLAGFDEPTFEQNAVSTRQFQGRIGCQAALGRY